MFQTKNSVGQFGVFVNVQHFKIMFLSDGALFYDNVK